MLSLVWIEQSNGPIAYALQAGVDADLYQLEMEQRARKERKKGGASESTPFDSNTQQWSEPINEQTTRQLDE